MFYWLFDLLLGAVYQVDAKMDTGMEGARASGEGISTDCAACAEGGVD